MLVSAHGPWPCASSASPVLWKMSTSLSSANATVPRSRSRTLLMTARSTWVELIIEPEKLALSPMIFDLS